MYGLKLGPRLGPGENDAKEALVLNRVLRWTSEGLECEADPRQAERLLSECGLEGAKSVATPGIRATSAEALDEQPLEARLVTPFRAAAARGNYLAQDRPDLQFSAKEICRNMSKPTDLAWGAMKRMCRFLGGTQRLVWKFRFQEASEVTIYSDTDWAGCPRTRKSTSGGCIMVGSHLLKSWSSTQSSVALSSGEAEFYGAVKAAGYGIAYQSLLQDLGVKMPVSVFSDSSAAIGIASRQGLGKLRHLDVHTLWLQQAVRSGRIALKKVLGTDNPADIFTKHQASRAELLDKVRMFDMEYRDGRAEAAPDLRREERPRAEMKDIDDSGDGIHLLPHLREDADREFPPIQAADDWESFDESCMHGFDFMKAHADRITQEIHDEVEKHGRRRKPVGET